MTTVSRAIPAKPRLDVPKKQAHELLKQVKQQFPDAIERIRRHHHQFSATQEPLIVSKLKLSDAQLVVAREYGFPSWPRLKRRIEDNTAAKMIDAAIRNGDGSAVVHWLKNYPEMLVIPVVSGNWGPPMSHAANLGLLNMVKVIAGLGAKDFQQAFGRALLHGDIEIAQWLHEHGAQLSPGIIMGCCETLNARGFAFLDEQGVPFTDVSDNALAPLAMVLETYSRNPEGKHDILRRFRYRGYRWPDSPIMAFHLGDIHALEKLYRKDPGIIHERFAYPEIYPPALGCSDNGLDGLHGTPLAGTTLLHMCIDYDEREIFDWLLQKGADVNAEATIDPEGFGGHTPLYGAVLGARRTHAVYMAKELLDRGARSNIKVNLRKYLDWIEEPGWHIAKKVTPLSWAESFPLKDWVNPNVVELIKGA